MSHQQLREIAERIVSEATRLGAEVDPSPRYRPLRQNRDYQAGTSSAGPEEVGHPG